MFRRLACCQQAGRIEIYYKAINSLVEVCDYLRHYFPNDGLWVTGRFWMGSGAGAEGRLENEPNP